jgi:hypothetical protein
MDDGFIFCSYITIWDANNNEKVKIGFETCKDQLIVPIYGPYGVENCILVLIEALNEKCEQWKLFCLI